MERIKNAIRQLRLRDFAAPFIFLLLLVPSLIFRLINKMKHRKLWLVAEQGEARDNGYHFYKYVREKHPKDFCFYAINPESAGLKKVEKLGNVIKWGSLRHWLYYMSANLNISSQKSGNPAPIFWYVAHVKLGLYKNRVFLQHGIIINDSRFVYYDCCKFKYFVCGAKREYDYILERFGYGVAELLLAGLSRWDDLKDTSSQRENLSILIMPTWRQWLGGERNVLFKDVDFKRSSYYHYWSELLNSVDFVELVEEKGITVYFYPHINMCRFIDDFNFRSNNIKKVLPNQDIQHYLGDCSLMITDYTSAMFDFAYLDKPIVYYQFDEAEYREKQYGRGYFDYERDGFGPVVSSAKSVVDEVAKYIRNNCKNDEKYSNRVKSFFTLHDKKNCERLYKELM